MKKLHGIIIIALLSFISIELSAQYAEDALRYSRLNYATGNAKATSMAGSLGALGANFASLSINPAGIGVYRKSEFTITPSIMSSTSNTDYLGKKRSDGTLNFNIGNVGAVVVIPASGSAAKSGFTNFQIGLGINRTNNFKREAIMKAFNETSSITSQWVDDANYDNPYFYLDDDGEVMEEYLVLNPYTTQLAFDTEVLYIGGNKDGIYSNMEYGYVDQRIDLIYKGSMNEFVFSGGFNYKDKLYVGATVGLPYFSFREDFTITEHDSENINSEFDYLKYGTSLYTSGVGVNFKVGAIYKPIQWLRVGLALHTPTRYSMTDDYSATLISNIDIYGNYNYVKRSSSIGYKNYPYLLTTPFKFIGSLGFVIGQHGSINFDYTFQDYSAAKFKEKDYDFFDYSGIDDENEVIHDSYVSGHQIAIGTEWMFGVLRLRAGYAYETSPYRSNDILYGERMTVGAGVGLSFGGFYTDFGYAFITEDTEFEPYNNYFVTPSKNKYNTNQFQLTLGFRF